MYGDVSAWFTKAIAGINPDPAVPGFRHIEFRPNFIGELQWAKAAFESVHGRIVSDWKREDGSLRLHVVVPANCWGTVFLPGMDAGVIRESGLPIAQARGVKWEGINAGKSQLRIEAGEYTFVIPAEQANME